MAINKAALNDKLMLCPLGMKRLNVMETTERMIHIMCFEFNYFTIKRTDTSSIQSRRV